MVLLVSGYRLTADYPRSSYAHCGCRDCFEITIVNDLTVLELCDECEKAGCELHDNELPDGKGKECQRADDLEFEEEN